MKGHTNTHLTLRGDERSHKHTRRRQGCSICWHTCLAGLCFLFRGVVCVCLRVFMCRRTSVHSVSSSSTWTDHLPAQSSAGDPMLEILSRQSGRKRNNGAIIIKTSILVNCVNWCDSSGSMTYRAEYHQHNR